MYHSFFAAKFQHFHHCYLYEGNHLHGEAMKLVKPSRLLHQKKTFPTSFLADVSTICLGRQSDEGRPKGLLSQTTLYVVVYILCYILASRLQYCNVGNLSGSGSFLLENINTRLYSSLLCSICFKHYKEFSTFNNNHMIECHVRVRPLLMSDEVCASVAGIHPPTH